MTTIQNPFIIARDPEALLSALSDVDIRVPKLTKGRQTFHTEQWMICRLMATLAKSTDLSFPLRVLHRDKPDFVVETPSDRVGVEATEAVGRQFAHYRAIAEREFPDAILEPGHFRWGAPKLSDKKIRETLSQPRLTSPGWSGDEAENEWAAAIDHSFRYKLDTLQRPDFKKYERNWLIVYDNLPLPDIDLPKAVGKLGALLHDAWGREVVFDALFIETGKAIARLTSDSVGLLSLNDLWPR